MKILVVISLAFIYIQTAKLSSLQIADHEINLKFNTAGNYLLNLAHDINQQSIQQIIYCFKETKTIRQPDSEICDLVDAQSEYTCIEVNYTGSGDSLIQQFIVYKFSKQKGIFQSTDSYDIKLYAEDVTRTVSLKKSILQDNLIYHMITSLSREYLLNYQTQTQNTKLSYAHTFAYDSYADTLIAQKNYYCILHTNKFVYIFQGAVQRSGNSYFFTAILTKSTDNSVFDMWGGYSYSSSHAARDMVGYQSSTQKFYDMYSLYASAPFEDIADNINGQKNVVRISNSQNSTNIDQTPYHFIQFYRLFDTEDINGDQILQRKINHKFCFAAFFANYTDTDQLLSVKNKNFKHQLIDCHTPDLTIFQQHILLNIFILASLVFLYQ